MKLEEKTVGILLEDLYEDNEFWYPFFRMKEEGATVQVIAPEIKEYKGKYGVPARSDVAVGEVEASKLDALVVPGGYSPDRMRRYPKMVELVRSVFKAGKPVATICHGAWMLASAKVVKGRRLTGFFAVKDDLEHAGAKWVDEPVVIDGNLITSRVPDDLPDFCRAIIRSLSS